MALDKTLTPTGTDEALTTSLERQHKVAAGAKDAETSITAGETKELDLRTPQSTPAQTGAPRPFTPPPAVEPSTRSTTRYVVGGTLVAAGLVGLGVGIGFGVASANAEDDAPVVSPTHAGLSAGISF